MKWDYNRIKPTSIAVCLLLIFAFTIVLYKMFEVKSLLEMLVCFIIFIAIVLMTGNVILWWMNRPED